MLVMIVDDEVGVRDLIRNVLTGAGYEVIEAENGIQGLQYAKLQRCDLIITDQIMPLLTGREMIARLATERYPARYLLISGYSQNVQVPSELPFLSKPFTISELVDATRRLENEPTLPELEKDWRLAQRLWQEAATEFKQIISDVPSGIPHPDGALRIERVALKRRTSHERYMEAFQQYRRTLHACGVVGGIGDDLGRDEGAHRDRRV
jgi:CheY-like chemotaxis protein